MHESIFCTGLYNDGTYLLEEYEASMKAFEYMGVRFQVSTMMAPLSLRSTKARMKAFEYMGVRFGSYFLEKSAGECT